MEIQYNTEASEFVSE